MRAERLQVRILGVVQGVGFRPFVYRLAAEEGLPGWVRNDQDGVTLEVEGDRTVLLRFLERLQREIPPAAWIHALDHRFLSARGLQGFEIVKSEGGGAPRVWILPDLATCRECHQDVADPDNRRHRYPFTNCTNCGPRFTIIEGLPYDRPLTSMKGFAMCGDCAREYADPEDRRFHAQPNACPLCGPRLELLERGGECAAHGPEALETALAWLEEGRILGVKGLGGYHLMVDATREDSVRRLRERKRRPRKAFAVMYPDPELLRRHVELPGFAAPLLESCQAPILILPRREAGRRELAESVAPGAPTLGVFLPYTPLHRLLLEGMGRPLVATSANLSEQPMLFDDEEATEHLPRWCDGILRHDRPIVRPADDSVLQVLRRPQPRPQLLRRARGYAPLPLLAPRELPCILALGGQMNSVFAVSRDRELLLSPHLGTLESFEARENYRRVLEDFLRLHELRPTRIAHDLHPDYFTSELAVELGGRWGVPRTAVQHHHAHLAACVLENGLEGEVLALTWDGTGYGADGSIWGGEILRGGADRFERVASLRSFPLPGGEQAIRESWRVGLALLYEVYGEHLPRELPLFAEIPPREIELVLQMLRRGLNSPRCTSMGRLFDGLAALLGLSYRNTHQAQSPQQLEYAAWRHGEEAEPLPLEFRREEGGLRIDWEPLIRRVVDEWGGGAVGDREPERDALAAGFHHALAGAALRLAREAGPLPVVLAGGVFCNRYLSECLVERLEANGVEAYLHSQLPPTDGSLAAGQLWVTANSL